MGRKNFLFAIVLVALIGCMGLATAAVGEGAMRWRERTRSTVPGSMEYAFYMHDRYRHALIRNQNHYGWINVNEWGFRGGSNGLEPDEGVFRIMTVGSSTTFDSYVSNDTMAWPAQLERKLNHNLVAPKRIEVLNAGVPGYVVLDNSIRLQNELHRFKPNLIILYEGHNNLFGALRLGDPFPQYGNSKPGEISAKSKTARWLEQNSLLYSKIRFFLAVHQWKSEASSQQHPIDTFYLRITDGVKRYERDLSILLHTASELDIPVVLPQMLQISGTDSIANTTQIEDMWRAATGVPRSDVVLHGYKEYNSAIERLAERFKLHHIATSGFGISGAEFYADQDPIHFNDAGATRMADSLSAALWKSTLLPH